MQSVTSAWLRWTTYDSATSVGDLMNGTEFDSGWGAITDVQRQDGSGDLQLQEATITFMHRDLNTGVLSHPVLLNETDAHKDHKAKRTQFQFDLIPDDASLAPLVWTRDTTKFPIAYYNDRRGSGSSAGPDYVWNYLSWNAGHVAQFETDKNGDPFGGVADTDAIVTRHTWEGYAIPNRIARYDAFWRDYDFNGQYLR